MIRKALSAIGHLKLQKQKIDFIFRFQRKISSHFSSFNYEKLNQSDFSKQLGLQGEYKEVIKIQKKNQKQSYRLHSVGFVIIIMIVGGFILIDIIDTNQQKKLKHKLIQVKSIFSFNKQKHQAVQKELQNEIQQNMKDIYDKNYKNRTIVDSKFLNQLEDSIKNKLSLMDYRYEHKQISKQILQILDQIREKFDSAQQQKIANKKEQFLNILEKVIYQQMTDKSLVSKDQQTLVSNFSLFLIKKGNINHQYLGIKYLISKHSNKPLSMIISFQQAFQIKQNIEKNRKILENSVTNKVQIKNKQNQLDDKSIKVESIKRDIFYSIKELKEANQIRENKIKFLSDICEKIISQNKKK